MNRRLARLRAVQALYQVDLTDAGWKEAIENTLDEGEEADAFLTETVKGTLDHKDEIDSHLKNHLQNWTLERVGNVDRAIMRESVYEMLFVEEIPLHVSVNEAIELAKSFGGQEAGKFVNGVLSKVLEDCKRL
ncbi:transcription antitermination factor NusB [Thalassorhabdus alkalitolerans]|uniref:Transcription antitermination protein NusB n=1 Tax=Thalassorhabdus alkalitolerans TaxID=2282697 RepID=A0ABW0YNI1_9BACI